MGRGNKIKIKVLEEYAYLLQTCRLPGTAKIQEKQLRKMYHAANFGRKLEGLPKKKYRILDSKGRLVNVE